MSTWFCGIALLIALAGAVGVVCFESPTRSAGGLITAFVGAAAALGALGAPLVPGFLLWVGGGIALLLLAAVLLLLNLSEDEHERRHVRVRPALAIPMLGLLWSALAAPLLEAVPDVPLPAPTSLSVATAFIDDLALPLTVALIALAGALIVAVALVRRRA
jgi:NADH:ubiquinone oxidoreductase subunit 6 (subunit J)